MRADLGLDFLFVRAARLRLDRDFNYDRHLERNNGISFPKEELAMLKKIVLGGLALLFFSGLVLAQAKLAAKEAKGKVKSVAAASITITDDASKDWTFIVDKDTSVTAKGASHKMREAEGANKSTQITDFVMEKQSVSLKYEEKDGKLYAREVKVN
jgi:hypothetical protein